MNSFAVVDVETTGFGRNDRIVEIAIVHVDNGVITQEWDTLVNPVRDISNSNIHGVTADLVSLAPVFEEIAGEICLLLNQRVFVAHNASFDARMIQQEFARLNYDLDLGDTFCTLQATKMKLSAACEEFKVINSLAHRALGDARATAEILLKLPVQDLVNQAVEVAVDLPTTPTRTLTRDAFAQELQVGSHSRFKQIPDFNETGFSGAQLSYLDALSTVMNDFVITVEEAEFLRKWAEAIGLSQDEQDEVHQDYMYLVLEAANRDGFISETENSLIKKAAKALGVHAPVIVESDIGEPAESFRPGKRVCFTGEVRDSAGISIPRESLEEMAIAKSLVPVSGVSRKSCELLVAADISSMSGKAKKAKDLQIQVVSARDFLEWVLT